MMAGNNAWYVGSILILLGLVAMAIMSKSMPNDNKENFDDTKLPYDTGRYDGMLGVGENTYVADKATVNGATQFRDTTVNQNISVGYDNSKNTVFSSDVKANASVDVARTLGIGGDWNVVGDLSFANATNTYSFKSGFVDVMRNVDVKGDMRSSGLVVNNDLDTSSLKIGGVLNVGDEKTRRATIDVNNHVSINSDMNVNGHARIDGGLNVRGDVELGNNSIFHNGESTIANGVESNTLKIGNNGRVLIRDSLEAKSGLAVGKTSSLMNGVVIGSSSSFGVNEDGTNIISGEATVVNGDFVCLNSHCLESVNIKNAKTLRNRIIPKMNKVRQIIKKQLNMIKSQHVINTNFLNKHTKVYESHVHHIAKESTRVNVSWIDVGKM
jgi:hypothetical protein